MVGVCPNCGGGVPEKPVGQVGDRKTYCSVRCRSQAQRKRERAKRSWDRSDRECKRCGKLFSPRTSHHRYCSEACQKEAANRLRFGEAAGVSNYYRTLFVLERGGVCERCGVPDGLEVHHIVRVALGGEHVPSNVLVLCDDCHKRQHAKSPPGDGTRSPRPAPKVEVPREVTLEELPVLVRRRSGWGGVGGKPPVPKAARGRSKS